MVVGDAKRYVFLREQAHDLGRIPTRTEFKSKSFLGESIRRKADKRSASAWAAIGKEPERLVAEQRQTALHQLQPFSELADSRFQWVMNLDAFHVKTKSLPVCSVKVHD
jgi:hypothetical protein